MNENLVYGVVFLYGIVIGSFLNVCIYRVPENTSIAHGRSHCMACNTQLKWYELIPLFSYIFLLGKCRTCRTKISIQYPLIELVNGVFYFFIFYINGWQEWSIILINSIHCMVVSALVVISIIDFRTYRIPFPINLFILIMALMKILIKYISSYRNSDILLSYVIGLFAISLFLLIIFLLTKGRGIGGGDIILMAVAGLLLGWELILLAFFIGCVLAGLIHPIRMVIGKQSRELAFGPYLSIGIITAILYGWPIINWYLKVAL